MGVKTFAFVVLLMGLMAGACGARGEADGVSMPVIGEELVFVENSTSRTLRISAIVGGAEMRIGTVGAMRAEVLRLPKNVNTAGHFQLVARVNSVRETNPGVRSEVVALAPDHIVRWRLEDRPGVMHEPIGRLSVVPQSMLAELSSRW
jgi:hypothetical protein